MTFYLIGIGLANEKDISVAALEAVRSCDEVYLEYYTSILGISPQKLSEFYGINVRLASRDVVEREAEKKLILPAKEKNIALLIVGDVFGATTHTDLQLRAKAFDVSCKIFFNASILTAVGIAGLELYKYGKTTSIVFPDDNWLPETPYDVIKQNKEMGLHTLCLLDIKVAELSKEDMLKQERDRVTGSSEQAGDDCQAPNSERAVSLRPMPPRYMTVNEALDVLLRIEEKRQENLITQETLVIGVARLGHEDYAVHAGTVAQLQKKDFGGPLHSLIVPGKLHHIEEEAVLSFQ
jgi:diphthine synthase